MSIYVVDASVILARIIREAHTPNTRVLFRGARSNLDQLYAPEFCRLECVNVLWKHVRFYGLSQVRAERAVKNLRALPIKLAFVGKLYTRALQIGLKHQIAIYDSIYIALSEQLKCPLITVDAAQSRAAAAESIVLKLITDFHP